MLLVGVANAETLAFPDAPSHSFLNQTSISIFAADGLSKALDGFTTSRAISNGATERNPIARPFVQGTAGQAVFFGLSWAGDLGLAYILHKTGHHKLEKILPIIAAGQSYACVGLNRMHH